MVYLIGALSQDRAGIGAHSIGADAGARQAAGIARSFASFLRFWAVAANRNSSRAPLGLRNLRRPSLRMRLRWANNVVKDIPAGSNGRR
jgi:hypothetical protein